ncbi:hypothetical protein BaRGS_00006525 [Batillaria attramentaria]|uniref:Uncharacterized protein n=1 Tax=Batillaria attramentaria TaxID=370345 RepID=A0ABD0LSL6_9CAEN
MGGGGLIISREGGINEVGTRTRLSNQSNSCCSGDRTHTLPTESRVDRQLQPQSFTTQSFTWSNSEFSWVVHVRTPLWSIIMQMEFLFLPKDNGYHWSTAGGQLPEKTAASTQQPPLLSDHLPSCGQPDTWSSWWCQYQAAVFFFSLQFFTEVPAGTADG